MRRIVFCLSVMLILWAGQALATPSLVDWVFNDNGEIYENVVNVVEDLPGYYDYSGFDWDTGLGSISITFSSAGDYSFISFFDHEMSRDGNTYYNEYGDAIGSPETGQLWEIDEPGWVFGDIYDNILDGYLDNSNAIDDSFEDDVSMAMGWEFSLLENEIATIILTISESSLLLPDFYLSQIDPDGTLYFSSTLTILSGSSPVPEPASIFLVFSGLAPLFIFRKLLSRK